MVLQNKMSPTAKHVVNFPVANLKTDSHLKWTCMTGTWILEGRIVHEVHTGKNVEFGQKWSMLLLGSWIS